MQIDTPPSDLQMLLDDLLGRAALLSAVLSETRDPRPERPIRVTVRPVQIKGRCFYQFASRIARKEMHENLPADAARERILALLRDRFHRAVLHTNAADVCVRFDRKGRLRLTSGPPTKAVGPIRHDRAKRYLLPPDQPVDFLVRLGVMKPDGRVIAARYDKLRQINRFLEMVSDAVDALPGDRPFTVVDFGCGKGYLTFALHHYLRQIAGLDAHMIGVDAKRDVVESCAAAACDLGFQTLRFEISEIRGFASAEPADMVVALHACDTATDDALVRAVRWGARVILAAPCCQHQLNGQIRAGPLREMLRYGIVRERFAALATDALRAAALEASGYTVQILEFVDSEHTPKNLLIRAIKRTGPAVRDRIEQYIALRDFLHADPAIDGLVTG